MSEKVNLFSKIQRCKMGKANVDNFYNTVDNFEGNSVKENRIS